MAVVSVFRIRWYNGETGKTVREPYMVTEQKLKELQADWRSGDGFGFDGPFEFDETDLDPDRPGCTKEMA
jgi:hypothetical protein